MSKSILVGYDPKTLDRGPVELGVAAARFTGAPLIVLAVAAQSHDDAHGQVDADLVADCSRVAAEIEAELDATDIPTTCKTVHSTSAARALHEAAEQDDAGLLVVGSSQRSGLGRAVAGSTAMRLLHGAPCAVAVAPRDWTAGGGLKTIGVAYVNTPEGREALRGAHALARRSGATLRVLVVVKVSAEMHLETEPELAYQHGTNLQDVEGVHRLQAEREARQLVDALEGDVTVDVDGFVGDPAEALVEVSEHLDLLVCGSRGYGPARAVLLGSVTRRLVAETQCPVIVLARGVERSLEELIAEAPGAPAAA